MVLTRKRSSSTGILSSSSDEDIPPVATPRKVTTTLRPLRGTRKQVEAEEEKKSAQGKAAPVRKSKRTRGQEPEKADLEEQRRKKVRSKDVDEAADSVVVQPDNAPDGDAATNTGVSPKPVAEPRRSRRTMSREPVPAPVLSREASRSNETDDEDTPVSSAALDVMNAFTKPQRRGSKATSRGGLAVILPQHKRTKVVEAPQQPDSPSRRDSGLSTIEEFPPVKGGEQTAGTERVSEEQEVEGVQHELEDSDEEIELPEFPSVLQIPSRKSPELGERAPKPRPGRPLDGSVWEVPEDGDDEDGGEEGGGTAVPARKVPVTQKPDLRRRGQKADSKLRHQPSQLLSSPTAYHSAQREPFLAPVKEGNRQLRGKRPHKLPSRDIMPPSAHELRVSDNELFGQQDDDEEDVGRQAEESVDEDAGGVGDVAPLSAQQHRDHDDSLFIQAPSAITPRDIVSVASSVVADMCEMMGWQEWTGGGDVWARRLYTRVLRSLRSSRAGAGSQNIYQENVAVTEFCGRSFSHIHQLRSALNKVPKAPDFDGQNQWLRESEEDLERPAGNIYDLVEDICSPDAADEHAELTQDLRQCVLPMLVLALNTAFALGGLPEEEETEHNPGMQLVEPCPLPDEGEFTMATLQYLARITGWIRRLNRKLQSELRAGTAINYNIHGQQQKNRGGEGMRDFSSLVIEFDQAIKDAVEELDKRADEEALKRKNAKKDQAVKRSRMIKEKQELAKKREQWALFCASTQEIKAKPLRPMQEVWQKASSNFVPSSSANAALQQLKAMQREVDVEVEDDEEDEEEEEGDYSDEDYYDASEGADNRPRHLVSGSPLPEYPRWHDEDKAWLCRELRRPDRKSVKKEDYEEFAEVLDKPLEEVLLEAELLRRTARLLAQERGVAVERWARER